MTSFVAKCLCCVLCTVVFMISTSLLYQEEQVHKTEQALTQLDDRVGVQAQTSMTHQHYIRNNGLVLGWFALCSFYLFIFRKELMQLFNRAKQIMAAALMVTLLIASSGCRKPFEPIKLEVIKSNEEAFLLPLTGDVKKQEASSNEEYLRSNLVYSKQVQIPQQWVSTGYETVTYNGEWRDAALLIKVDKSPITREWTADVNTGTGTKNEAIWVMTSDQVEFSTGWTITARIASREDAVKFLHNYPNGSLTTVLDTEVRSKIQAVFGLEVTDLSMDELRKNATPHVLKVVQMVTNFFKERGINITNIGISGGFVYKDKSILDTMVKVFNAEQERSIAVAATNAQEERNKAVIFKAQGEADAIIKTKKAEADGIKLIADAKNYELDKAKQDLAAYMQLKQLELQRDLLMKWNGEYPRYFIGGGQTPQTLLQLPAMEKTVDKK